MNKLIKVLLTVAFTVFVAVEVKAQGSAENNVFNDISAVELVASIKSGVGLASTFDLYNKYSDPLWPSPENALEIETIHNPRKAKERITAYKEAGFDAVRITVAWHNAMDSEYNINAAWMARITEVVDYAVDNDMYIFLNSHNDENIIIHLTNEKKAQSLAAFQKMWAQIADNFKHYNEKLVFEAINEPHLEVWDWLEYIDGCENLNEHYKVFVETVRTSGGFNDKRILMVKPYGAEGYLQSAVDALVIPDDPGNDKGKFIVDIHSYNPFPFTHGYEPRYYENQAEGNFYPIQRSWNKDNYLDVISVIETIEPAYEKFVLNGIPVIVGEFGTQTAGPADETTIAQWTEFVVSYARSKGMPCFWWDDIHWSELFDRDNFELIFPEIYEALMRGAKGEGDITVPDLPTVPEITGNLGNYFFNFNVNNGNIDYTTGVWNLSGEILAKMKEPTAQLVLKLSKMPTSDMRLLWSGQANDWSWDPQEILIRGGRVRDMHHAFWDTSTNSLTINLPSALNDYDAFLNESSALFYLEYISGINDMGIISANIVSGTAYPDFPDAPTEVASWVRNKRTVQISWSSVEAADSFYVYRLTTQPHNYYRYYLHEDKYQLIAVSEDNVFYDTNVPNGYYYYRVSSVADDLVGQMSAAFGGTLVDVDDAVPTDVYVLVADWLDARTVRVTWSPVEDAESYKVYRSTSADGDFEFIETSEEIFEWAGEIYYVYYDKNVPNGTYFYRVTAITAEGESPMSAVSPEVTIDSDINPDLPHNDETPIRDIADNTKQGIVFAENPTSDTAKIITSEGTVVRVVIYDALGNLVHIGSDSTWDLRNSAGRRVAEGMYLVTAEVRGRDGTVRVYSARLGVKR